MKTILKKSFFNREALSVAEDLIGKRLVFQRRGKHIPLIITETEAYDGPNDLACHGSKGNTKRTWPMFGPAGHWYIYLIYGMYWMLNIVTGPEDYPAAILIRGALSESTPVPLNGPGKITKHLGITKSVARTMNGNPANKETGLWIEDHGIVIPQKNIERSARIGVEYAGAWAQKPYRFFINPSVIQ